MTDNLIMVLILVAAFMAYMGAATNSVRVLRLALVPAILAFLFLLTRLL